MTITNETMRVWELRDALNRPEIDAADVTDISEIKIRSGSYKRVWLVPFANPETVAELERACGRKVQELDRLTGRVERLQTKLRKLREAARTRAPKLP